MIVFITCDGPHGGDVRICMGDIAAIEDTRIDYTFPDIPPAAYVPHDQLAVLHGSDAVAVQQLLEKYPQPPCSKETPYSTNGCYVHLRGVQNPILVLGTAKELNIAIMDIMSEIGRKQQEMHREQQAAILPAHVLQGGPAGAHVPRRR